MIPYGPLTLGHVKRFGVAYVIRHCENLLDKETNYDNEC